MAECAWNEEMSEGPDLLQEDLTCPVCKDLYREPVLLSCSHSFCKECLEQSRKMVQRCPVCRKSCDGEQPISNRALMAATESFQKEKRWRGPNAINNVPLCNLHRLELQLYCVKDEEPVCVDCVTLHRTHELLPLNKGAPLCKIQTEQAEKQIKAEFERLRQVLCVEEAARLKALADEEEDKRSGMEERISSLTSDIAALTKLVQTVKREMGAEDLTFLQNFQALKKKAQWPREDPQNPSDALLNMAKHVGSLGYSIWKSMQAHVTCIPVVMDPNTASPWLSMSPDLASVRDSPERQSLPDNPERFDPCVFVLGAEGFCSGKHRWEVHVGDNPKWILGICKESVARKRKFTVSTDRGVWTIGLSKGVYNALTGQRTVLVVERRPERIRVKLNMDKGEVSFWDAGNGGKHLCTFTHKFTERVFPIFGPGLHTTPMEVKPAKVTIHTA
uniref:Zinc-binding protein A33-like n=1 Tax=Oncorhynchus tshawytscha TaxID=74940 RepID=A0A8C8I546_ONCTS